MFETFSLKTGTPETWFPIACPYDNLHPT